MGLTNINHQKITNSMIKVQESLLKNPYYLFNDKKATPVTYFNLNTTKSTLDEALSIPYKNLGEDSPLRFNIIHDLYIYGIDRAAMSLENGEFGLESGEISGDAYILPDTINPYPGDYFIIDMIKQKYLFRVIDVSSDTFNNGANYWKLSYKLDRLDADDSAIKKLVVEEFKFNSSTVGSNYKSVVKKTKWDLASTLDDLSVMLKVFYRSLFFNEFVQTYTCIRLYFVCKCNQISDYFYDPYLIDFMIKNKIMENSGEGNYHYLSHKTMRDYEFPIRYTRTIWRMIETKNIDMVDNCIIRSGATLIDDPGCIFNTRFERYYQLNYLAEPIFGEVLHDIPIVDQNLLIYIKNKTIFKATEENAIYNIIVKYMNDMEYTIDDIAPLERINENFNSDIYYFLIPILIYCVDSKIKELLS
jgi:hypothetical protein